MVSSGEDSGTFWRLLNFPGNHNHTLTLGGLFLSKGRIIQRDTYSIDIVQAASEGKRKEMQGWVLSLKSE